MASQVIKIISAPVKPEGSAFRAGWSRACSGAVLTPRPPPATPTPAPTLLVLAGHLILQPYSLTILQSYSLTILQSNNPTILQSQMVQKCPVAAGSDARRLLQAGTPTARVSPRCPPRFGVFYRFGLMLLWCRARCCAWQAACSPSLWGQCVPMVSPPQWQHRGAATGLVTLVPTHRNVWPGEGFVPSGSNQGG